MSNAAKLIEVLLEAAVPVRAFVYCFHPTPDFYSVAVREKFEGGLRAKGFSTAPAMYDSEVIATDATDDECFDLASKLELHNHVTISTDDDLWQGDDVMSIEDGRVVYQSEVDAREMDPELKHRIKELGELGEAKKPNVVEGATYRPFGILTGENPPRYLFNDLTHATLCWDYMRQHFKKDPNKVPVEKRDEILRDVLRLVRTYNQIVVDYPEAGFSSRLLPRHRAWLENYGIKNGVTVIFSRSTKAIGGGSDYDQTVVYSPPVEEGRTKKVINNVVSHEKMLADIEKVGNIPTLDPVRTIAGLDNLAGRHGFTTPELRVRYANLAMVTAKNLGGDHVKDLNGAIRWLYICAQDAGEDGEEDVVLEINSCRELV